ncbi:hypothetical protein CK203_083810 [Vitis vinifera]|uniref:MHD1 domain-containing protein n=1 Tax=Vitis vinifera TaxID=29760 RepID=A0A438DLQ8_VITVI|nr:hypothetical protein CK203_083810 [Vitis vinifera]
MIDATTLNHALNHKNMVLRIATCKGSPVGLGEHSEALSYGQHPGVWVSMESPKDLAMEGSLDLTVNNALLGHFLFQYIYRLLFFQLNDVILSIYFTGSVMMEEIVAVAMISRRLLLEEPVGAIESTLVTDQEQIEAYVSSSTKHAFARVEIHKQLLLQHLFFTALWEQIASYLQKPFLDGAEHLTEDVVSVFPAADSLEQCIIAVITTSCEEGTADAYCRKLTQYQIETISGTLVMRWVNAQLARVLGWVERAIQQEACKGASMDLGQRPVARAHSGLAYAKAFGLGLEKALVSAKFGPPFKPKAPAPSSDLGQGSPKCPSCLRKRAFAPTPCTIGTPRMEATTSTVAEISFPAKIHSSQGGSFFGLVESSPREAEASLNPLSMMLRDGSTVVLIDALGLVLENEALVLVDCDVAKQGELSAELPCEEGWSEEEFSKLTHFSKVLGMLVEGHEVEILALLKKLKLRIGSSTLCKKWLAKRTDQSSWELIPVD